MHNDANPVAHEYIISDMLIQINDQSQTRNNTKLSDLECLELHALGLDLSRIVVPFPLARTLFLQKPGNE